MKQAWLESGEHSMEQAWLDSDSGEHSIKQGLTQSTAYNRHG